MFTPEAALLVLVLLVGLIVLGERRADQRRQGRR